MAKGIKMTIAFAVIIVALLISGVTFFNTGLKAVNSGDSTEITVEVPEGSSAYGILESLDEAGLVKNKLCAKVYMKVAGPKNLQAYTYVLNKSMDFRTIMDIISTGDLKYVLTSKFTIIEGATSKDAAADIADATSLSEEEMLTAWNDDSYLKELIKDYWFLSEDILNKDIICPLEGYLYPDTYFLITNDPTADDITRQILDNTMDKLDSVKSEIEKCKLGFSIHELLTFASVVENESLFEEDRAVIAGVFANRLNENMPMQSDITVLYPLGEKRVDVRESDLQIDSKYNTYKYSGLPVGPVSNPSIGTITDCLNYNSNDYLYFFATEEGKVIYSKTYEEHLKVIDENGWY